MTKLIDAVKDLLAVDGHNQFCLYVTNPGYACNCGAWGRAAAARGNLVRMLRELEGKP